MQDRRNHCPRITEKRLQNKRFRATEEAILKAYLSGGDHISVCQIAAKANITRPAFYLHHRSIASIIPDYQVFLLAKYTDLINKILPRDDTSVRGIFSRMLLFIIHEKRFFNILASHPGSEIFAPMLKMLESHLTAVMRLPSNSNHIYAVYSHEIVALLEQWQYHNFDNQQFQQILQKILRITDAFPNRIGIFL